jgi:hypothetical protein
MGDIDLFDVYAEDLMSSVPDIDSGDNWDSYDPDIDDEGDCNE